MKSRLLFATSMLMVCTSAFALTPNVPPAADPDPVVAALSASQSGAVSGSLSGAKANSSSKSNSASASKSKSASVSGSKSNATGGNATGGRSSSDSVSNAQSGDSSAASESSSDNDTNVSSDDDTFIPRNTPPVMLPTLIVNECGAGASAGGSGTGGAGALSGLWTSKRCYALKSASIAFGVGDYEQGCVLMSYVNREANKAMGYTPDCKAFAKRLNDEAKAAHVVIRDPVDLSSYPTRAEVNERVDRAFKGAIGK